MRVRVVVPAAGVLQKCWRGKKGREEGALRRRMAAAATEIQVGFGVRVFRRSDRTDVSPTHDLDVPRQIEPWCTYVEHSEPSFPPPFMQTFCEGHGLG